MNTLIGQNYTVIYLFLVGILLFLSWYFWRKSQHDERRRNRFMVKNVKRHMEEAFVLLKNKEQDKFLRESAFPEWVTSQRINIVRFAIIFLLSIYMLVGFLNRETYLGVGEIVNWLCVIIILTPKEKFPLSWFAKFLNLRRQNDISNEVYQLYNDLTSAYFVLKNPKNVYYQIQELIPYKTYIRPTLEKMLPYLERKQADLAWEIFSSELDMDEATTLAIVMTEVESLSISQAGIMLEQKRNEMANHIYNRHTDNLRRRKNTIYVLVFIGALTVFFNESTVFYMWYKDIMSVANQLSS